jgi:uncharacterized alkaline shock family protein YloU
MDPWNRLVVIVVAVLVVVSAVVTALVATEAVDPDLLPGGSGEEAWFYEQLNDVADFDGAEQTIAITLPIVVGVAALALLALEVRSIVRKRPSLQISSSQAGGLTVEASSVQLLAERTGLANRNINDIRCHLKVTRRPVGDGPTSIVIACYPRVNMGGNLQEIGDDLQVRIKDVVERLTGLAVLRVNVAKVRYDRNDDRRLID